MVRAAAFLFSLRMIRRSFLNETKLLSENVMRIDQSIKDEILRYSGIELLRKLYPGIRIPAKGAFRSPFRPDNAPSFSCFRDRYGVWRWKDFGTEETGDNIDLYRKLYPGTSYMEAVDRLSFLLFGRSAVEGFERGKDVPFYQERRKPVVRPELLAEPEHVLKVLKVSPAVTSEAPEDFVSYWRGRCISDDVVSAYCSLIHYTNTNRVGKALFDRETHLPMLGADGRPLLDDGNRLALGLHNEVGGWSLRAPKFKGNTTSFVSFIFADGGFMSDVVRLEGAGDFLVTEATFNPQDLTLRINDSQMFVGLWSSCGPFAEAFMSEWVGRQLSERDLKNVTAVLNSLCAPCGRVATVVEGMFDALSLCEIQRLNGRGIAPGTDVVILNSVSNLKWAIPYLSRHTEVHSLLDLDGQSKAGQKAFDSMCEKIRDFSRRCCMGTFVKSYSDVFLPYKDLNDALKAGRKSPYESSPF